MFSNTVWKCLCYNVHFFQIGELISTEGNLLSYMRKMASSVKSLSQRYFNKYENLVIYYFIKLIVNQVNYIRTLHFRNIFLIK